MCVMISFIHLVAGWLAAAISFIHTQYTDNDHFHFAKMMKNQQSDNFRIFFCKNFNKQNKFQCWWKQWINQKQPKQQQWTEKNCTKYETKNAKKIDFYSSGICTLEKNKNETKFYSGGGDNGKSIIIIILYESLIEYESTTIYVCGYIYRFVSVLFFLNADFWKWDENWKVFFCTFWISNTHTRTPQFFHTLQANNPPETKN